MSATASPMILAMLRRRTFMPARNFFVVRPDFGSYRFTTHDQFTQIPSLELFSPRPGIVTFARRKEIGLRDSSSELQGFIDKQQSPTGITFSDLEAGRLRGATIFEYLVDAQFDFIGNVGILFDVWYVTEQSFTGREWTLKLRGHTSRLKAKHGDFFSRECQNELGVMDGVHSFCPVNVTGAPFLLTGCTVNATTTPGKRQLTVAKSGITKENQWWAFGSVSVTSGQNAGLDNLIESSVGGAGDEVTLELQHPMPYTFSVGDQLTLRVGCDKTPFTCASKFSAFQGISGVGGFRGAPDMPGADRILRMPRGS